MSDTIAPPLDSMTPRTVHLAPFGKHTRFLLLAYLRHVLMVMAVLLAIALTIDLWPQFQQVASHGGAQGWQATWNLIRFAALRTPGLTAPFLPFSAFLGVLWTEVAHTQSGERMLVWNSGRSPRECLIPVLLLSLLLGTGEFVLDGILRPASMVVQMAEKIGIDGAWQARDRERKNRWIALPDGLIRADITVGPPLLMRHLVYFHHDSSGHLTEVLMAKRASRIDTHRWRLDDGKVWQTPKSADAVREDVQLVDTGFEPMTKFVTRTIEIKADPAWLDMYDIEPQYLPLSVLRPLARSRFIPQHGGEYATRLHVVYGGLLLPGAMALLAATLSTLFLAYATSALRIVAIVFVGYMAHFATKAFLLLGMKEAIAPALAGWTVPIGLVIATATLLWREARLRQISAG